MHIFPKLFGIITTSLILSTCSSGKKANADSKAELFFNCNDVKEWQREMFKNSILNIELPADWDVLENVLDDIQGVISADSSNGMEFSNWISLIYLPKQEDLEEYFRKEVLSATDSWEYEVVEYGRYNYQGNKGYWFSYIDNHEHVSKITDYTFSIVYYPELKSKDYTFVVTAVAYGDKDQNARHCNMFRSIMTLHN
jgi:hypothetical protein